jgi:hypothetical protein
VRAIYLSPSGAAPNCAPPRPAPLNVRVTMAYLIAIILSSAQLYGSIGASAFKPNSSAKDA